MATTIATSDIAAQAFIMAELSPLSSFADDTPQAQSANQFYQTAIEMRLEAYDWTFASKLVRLAQVADLAEADLEIDDALPYAFELPGDFLSLREIDPEPTLWQREGDFLRADSAGPLLLRYTRKITDESKLPPTFRASVAAQLALLFAPRWVKSNAKRQELQASLADLHDLARRNDRMAASSGRHDGRPRQGSWAEDATA